MPCYDKKLEAVRPDFNDTKEVDNVLATHELLDLMNQIKVDFTGVKAYEPMVEAISSQEEQSLIAAFFEECVSLEAFQMQSYFNRSSHGYAEYIFRRVAGELYQVDLPPA